MKKVNYLFGIMILMITLACSCEKENVTPDDPQGITVEDLVGNWDFQSLEFNGATTTDCDHDLNITYDLVTFDLVGVTTNYMTIKDDCEPWQGSGGYELTGDVLDWDGGARVFKIVSLVGSTLKLKLESGTPNNLPYGGVYTLNKQ